MRLKLLYTAILIFCISGFASSNECSRTCEAQPCLRTVKSIPADKPLVSQREQPAKDEVEDTPFQVIKLLYI
jgi:hypothetical protein